MIPALIGAAGSLLGGLFNRPPSAEKQSYQGIMGQARGARDAAEQYGFNPLTLLGVSSPLGMGSSPMMGNAISDAFSLLADGLGRRGGTGEKEALTRENADLRQQLTRATLHPKEPSIYGRGIGPTIGGGNAVRGGVSQAVPVSGAAGVAVAGADAAGQSPQLRPLPETSEIDPRRAIDHEPVRTHSGFFTIDNPNLPFPVYAPTLDGDEALGWYDYPSVVLPVVGSGLYRMYRGFRDEQRAQASSASSTRGSARTPPRRLAFGFSPHPMFGF